MWNIPSKATSSSVPVGSKRKIRRLHLIDSIKRAADGISIWVKELQELEEESEDSEDDESPPKRSATGELNAKKSLKRIKEELEELEEIDKKLWQELRTIDEDSEPFKHSEIQAKLSKNGVAHENLCMHGVFAERYLGINVSTIKRLEMPIEEKIKDMERELSKDGSTTYFPGSEMDKYYRNLEKELTKLKENMGLPVAVSSSKNIFLSWPPFSQNISENHSDCSGSNDVAIPRL